MAKLVPAEVPIVPVAFAVTTQLTLIGEVGLAPTLMAYACPGTRVLLRENGVDESEALDTFVLVPFASAVSVSPAGSPVTVPESNETQVTTMSETFVVPVVPAPRVTEHVSPNG
jgi:hypothetical protein